MDEFYSPSVIIGRHHRRILQTINTMRHYRWILQTINVCVIIEKCTEHQYWGLLSINFTDLQCVRHYRSILQTTSIVRHHRSVLQTISICVLLLMNSMRRSLLEAQIANSLYCASTGVNLQTVRNVRHYQRIRRPPTSRTTSRITECVSLQRRLSISYFLAWVKDKCIPRH